MKKLIAIIIMFLLIVQTVQLAISTPPDLISCSISLDEDIETKEIPVKKLQKEYSFCKDDTASFLLSTNSLFQTYLSFIPPPPSLQISTPPPDQGC